MKAKELLVIKDDQKEISHFLRQVVAAGNVYVELDSQRYHLTARAENISDQGRAVLFGGPEIDD